MLEGKLLTNIIKNMFGKRQAHPDFLEDYNALKNECERLRTENTALKEQLTEQGIPLPNEVMGEMSEGEAPVAQNIEEPLAIDVYKSGAASQISFAIPKIIHAGKRQPTPILMHFNNDYTAFRPFDSNCFDIK